MDDQRIFQDDAPAQNYGPIAEIWGSAVAREGWTSIPNSLLKKAHQLDLDSAELVLITYLLRFWWKREKLPFPSIEKIAQESGISRRTLDRKVASLTEKGLLEVNRERGETPSYDLRSLVARVRELSNG
jgi:DNA-binding transcriptional ArsR family regulator